MNTEYPINKLSDFLAVPADKQAECLRDFAAWLDCWRKPEEIQAELESEFPGVGAKARADSFVWLDDGCAGISTTTVYLNGVKTARANGGGS